MNIIKTSRAKECINYIVKTLIVSLKLLKSDTFVVAGLWQPIWYYDNV